MRAAVPAATLAVVAALDPQDARGRVAGTGADLVLAKSAPPTQLAAQIAGYAASACEPPPTAAGTPG